MQKKLIALAVAGLASAGAFAQSNVTIYGAVNAGFEFVNVSSGAVTGVNSVKYNRVQDQTSRIGFKGVEDLGNGLKAVWQIESGFDVSGNREALGTPGTYGNVDGPVTNSGSTGVLGNRNTFVGLTGGFGTVVLGRHDTPYKLSGQKLNVFSGTTADYDAIVGEGTTRFDLRANNVLAYLTPNFSGFSGAIAYVANETKGWAGNLGPVANGEVSSPSAWSGLVSYDNGPIYASLAYEKHQNFNTIANSAPNAGLYVASGNVGDGNSENAWKVSGAYTFAPNSLVGLLYEEIKAKRANGLGGSLDRKDKHWGIVGQYEFGKFVAKAQYLWAKDAKGSTIAVGAENNGSKFWTLGLDYNLSKRTTAYALYAKMNNEEFGSRNFLMGVGGGNGNVSLTSGLASVNRGQDAGVFGLGLRHSF